MKQLKNFAPNWKSDKICFQMDIVFYKMLLNEYNYLSIFDKKKKSFQSLYANRCMYQISHNVELFVIFYYYYQIRNSRKISPWASFLWIIKHFRLTNDHILCFLSLFSYQTWKLGSEKGWFEIIDRRRI